MVRQLTDLGLYPQEKYIHPSNYPLEERAFPPYQFPADCYGYPCPKESGLPVEVPARHDLQEKYEGMTVLSNILLASFVLFCSGEILSTMNWFLL